MSNSFLDFHADDYALSEHSDNDILDLCREGALDSISVIPNLLVFESAVRKFILQRKSFPKNVTVSVHLNVMEGMCLAPKELLPNLVDKDGFFSVSWGKLFIWNYIPILRKKLRHQLSLEIKAQIEQCVGAGICNKKNVRIDSHQHPHMIPVFFDALLDALSSLEKDGYSFSYIRNSQDPISFYHGRNVFSLNVVKCFILNFYSLRVRKFLQKKLLAKNILCGVYYSGKMDERTERVIPIFLRKAKMRNCTAEILFHPGTMSDSELSKEFNKIGFNNFHLSECRKIEADTLRNFYRKF